MTRDAAARDRPVALITGASAGIGLAFAEILAERGHDLALVARRRERLEEIAARLRERGVRAEPVVADLAQRGSVGAVETMFRETESLLGPVDLLINNAGYGLAGRFLEIPWDDHRRFLDVLLTSVVEATHRALPGMLERGRGAVINVASLAAFVPEPASSLYTPVKRFVVSFTRAIALELRGSPVRVTASCPGFTYSEFHDVLGNREAMNRLPRWLWMDARAVAEHALAANAANRTVTIPGWVNKTVAALCHFVPTSLVPLIAPRAILERHESARRR